MPVTISAAVKSNLQALQSISSQAQTSQNILSTGKKVNSALDNATSFFTASSLNSRASSLTGLLDSVSNGIQTIQAANNGITSITKLVDQLKSTAKQALSSASAYSSQAKVDTTAIAGAVASDLRGTVSATTYASAAFTGAAKTSTATGTPAFATTTLLSDTTLAANDTLTVNGTTLTFKNGGTIGANDVDISAGGAKTLADLLTKVDTAQGGTGSTVTGGKLVINTGTAADLAITGTGGSLTALGLGTGATLARTATPGTSALDGKTLSFSVAGGAALAVKFGDPASSPGSVKSLDDLNSKLSSIGLSAAVDATGKLSFSTTSATASKSFTVSADATVAGLSSTARASTAPSRGGAGADARDSIVTQYNGLLDQINTLAKDASFNGLNLLQGDTLSLVFNETNTSKLSVTGSDASFSGLGLSKVTASDFNDGDGINSVLSALTNSSTNLASSSSKLGTNLAVVQTRQDFTKNLANTLSTGADNLVNADLNEEATKLLSLNTSQSLAQQALSLANQASQGVLRLLQ